MRARSARLAGSACLAAAALLAACESASQLNPLADPREQGPFIAQSTFPSLPNIALAAPSQACAGAPLRAVEASLPEYPARGWARGLQGWSIVQFDVAPTGAVENVRIAHSVPGGSFDAEARRAVRDWRFQPLDRDAPLLGCTVFFEFRMGEVRLR